ncbi:MAG TPA: efflux RND transporter periplasmic adaptor subunit [Blastocatellia bacterium]|nr:efflux RND transporter periplasmic adaptor subunit [Blastocatellia bacterium]
MEDLTSVNHEPGAAQEQPASQSRPGRVRPGPWLLVPVALLMLCVIVAVLYRSGESPRKESKAAGAVEAATPGANLAADVVTANDKELQQLTIEPVGERTIDLERETTGKVAFNDDRMTPVFTPYAGRAVEVLANKGAMVRQGQPLLVVESPEVVTAGNDLSAARSDADKARIALDAAEKAAERARRLHEREALATRDLQQAETDLARTREELRRAEAAVAVAENKLALFGKSSEEIAQLANYGKGGVDRRVVIRAPITGTVVERKVGPGQYIKPDTPDPLFLISDLSTLWVMADVYESLLPGIRVGSPVQISTATLPDRGFPARISFISPTVDAATRTVRVRCVVPNKGGLLKPEMFAKITIGAAVRQSVPVIPSSALLSGNDSFAVFVEEAHGRFHRREVRPGRDLEGFTVIEEGLKPGERIVTHGALLLNGAVGKPPEGESGSKVE